VYIISKVHKRAEEKKQSVSFNSRDQLASLERGDQGLTSIMEKNA
jgi:hypothetical protein